MDKHLCDAIQKIGGAAQVARHLRISVQAVAKWKKTPGQRVLEIEKLSGVSRHALRPDIFGPEAKDVA